MATNGWHRIGKFNVYVKNGNVTSIENEYGHIGYAYAYSDGIYVRMSLPVRFNTLRSGVYKGTWRIA